MKVKLDLRKGAEYNAALELVRDAILGSPFLPRGEAAQDAFDIEFDRALEILYPIREE